MVTGLLSKTIKNIKDESSKSGDSCLIIEQSSINGHLVLLRMIKVILEGFRGGAVVKNPPANAGDAGSSPGLGRSHMPRSS